MLNIISERTLNIDEKFYACFIDWPKTFARVNWAKLLQILRGKCVDLRERRLISKLYVDQCVKVRLDRGKTRNVEILRGGRKTCCFLLVLFYMYCEYLTNEDC
jgi:hypothetical protein